MSKEIQVAIASGLHLFPSRTEKLNLTTPMVLRKWESRQPPLRKERNESFSLFFCSVCDNGQTPSLQSILNSFTYVCMLASFKISVTCILPLLTNLLSSPQPQHLSRREGSNHRLFIGVISLIGQISLMGLID